MPSQNGSQYQGVESTGASSIVPDIVVDMRSDTLTLPSQGMRDAIANAIVGDDVFEEDPTTKEFETRVAKLLGKEAALLVSSGTQGNLLCCLVHCDARGSELICGEKCHIFRFEQGNVAQFGGIHSCQIDNEKDGTLSIDALKLRFRHDDFHYPITKLVCIENTNNECGGRVLPLKWLDELSEVCKARNVPIHMDGARLFNASIASGVPVSRIVRDVSSVSVCLSKGLGAPAGSVIAGTKEFIAKARRLRKALGGGMRQNGILSAAGIYCLDNMIERLQEDHDNAKLIANIVNSQGNKKNVWIDPEQVETNIVFVNVENMPILDFCEKLASVEEKEREGMSGKTVSVKCFPVSSSSVRLVTHFNISRELAEQAAQKICYVAKLSQS